MSKAQMIQAIIGAAKGAATVAGKHCDTTDLFFTLAFRTDRELKAIYKKLLSAA